MRNLEAKQILSNNKGVTLISLIVTIIVMVIIVGVSINIGTESLDSTRLQGFYTQLEIVQKRIDDIASTNESYIDSSGNTIYLKEQGTAYSNLSASKKAVLTEIIQTEGAGMGLNASNFRYFTVDQLKSILDLTDIEYNVFVDFDTRTVIAEDGITIGEQTYHILVNSVYFPTEDTTKNEGIINSLNYTVSKYGSSNYKIVVSPSNTIGDLDSTGTLKYKKSTSSYWETADNLEIIVNELTQYDILYEDNNKNSLTKTIELSLDSSGNPIITEI